MKTKMGLFDIFKKDKQSEPKTAIERKLQNEKCLKSLGIPFIDHLPLIEEEHEVRVRTSQEIAKRILVLTYLNYVAEEPEDREKVVDFLKVQELWDSVSRDETKLFKKRLTDKDKINISWRSEAIWILLWTINKVDNLDLPIEEIEVSTILDLLPDFLTDTYEFVEKSTLRTVSEILDISDLTYRLHWAAREAYSNKEEIPGNLNSSILQERHYAINWATYYGEDWDEITTDT
jgi:hypothetical protein